MFKWWNRSIETPVTVYIPERHGGHAYTDLNAIAEVGEEVKCAVYVFSHMAVVTAPANITRIDE